MEGICFFSAVGDKPPTNEEAKVRRARITQGHTSKKGLMFGQSYLSPQTLVRQLSSLDDQLGETLNWPNPSVRNKNINSVKPADSILDLCLLTAASLWHFGVRSKVTFTSPVLKGDVALQVTRTTSGSDATWTLWDGKTHARVPASLAAKSCVTWESGFHSLSERQAAAGSVTGVANADATTASGRCCIKSLECTSFCPGVSAGPLAAPST